MVLHYLHRAAVSALFSLVVLLITYCVVKSHFLLLFEQINKEKKEKEKKQLASLRFCADGIFNTVRDAGLVKTKRTCAETSSSGYSLLLCDLVVVLF